MTSQTLRKGEKTETILLIWGLKGPLKKGKNMTSEVLPLYQPWGHLIWWMVGGFTNRKKGLGEKKRKGKKCILMKKKRGRGD